MTTFGDLVEEVRANLRGYTRDQEASTYLTGSINSSVLSMNVNDPAVLSRGRVEIDEEIIYLESVSRTSQTITIPPYGRGSDGTTAASHSANAKVTFQPLFPTAQIKRAINETILQVDGTLFAVARTTLTANAAKVTYELPAAVKSIVSVEWDNGTATEVWTPVRKYRVNQHADTTAFPSGISIDIADAIPPGRTIVVVYRKALAPLVNTSDDFTAVSGLLERARDVIVYGAQFRLAAQIDVANLTTNAIERAAFEGYGKQQIGDGTSLAKFFYTMHQQRLAEEQAYLNSEYPIRPYHTR